MPSPFHQRIVRFLFGLLQNAVAALGPGEVFFAPLPIRLWPGKFRDPDIVYLKPGRISDPHHQPQGADLVVEVVSEDDEDRAAGPGNKTPGVCRGPHRRVTGSLIPKSGKSPF